MPTSEFAAALSERIEFAVFIAYERWLRETAYTSDNPYDVLARLLPGLDDALGKAVAARGGWSALEPVAGLPADAARHLVNEMAAQVASAQVAALAPHVPGVTLLMQVLTDAVGRAVTVFVDDPDSWRLAMQPGERAPLATLSDATGAAGGDHHAGEDAPLPAAPVLPDEGGDSGGARIVHAIENTARAPEGLLAIRELWFAKAGSAGPGVDAFSTLLDAVLVKLGTDAAADAPADVSEAPAVAAPAGADAPLPASTAGHDAGAGLADQADASGQFGLKPSYAERLDALPGSASAVIHAWIDLLARANFYNVGPDGTVHHLSADEAGQVVDTLIQVLIGRAEQELSLPALPEGYQPRAQAGAAGTPAAAGSEVHPAAIADAALLPGGHDGADALSAAPPPGAGLGSGSLDFAALAGGTAPDHAPDPIPAAASPENHAAAGADGGPAAVIIDPSPDAPPPGPPHTLPEPTHPHADYLFT